MDSRASVLIAQGDMFEDLSLPLPFVSSATESEIDLAAVVEGYSTLLFRVANSVVRNPAEAEDVVQDVFVRMMQHKRALPDVRDLRVWLVRIAWNLALDHRRRIRPDQMDDVHAAALAGTAIPADVAIDEARRIRVVMDAIDRLSQVERQALSLSAMEELDTHEVARVMNKSESAVRALLFRARTHLRERLAGKGIR